MENFSYRDLKSQLSQFNAGLKNLNFSLKELNKNNFGQSFNKTLNSLKDFTNKYEKQIQQISVATGSIGQFAFSVYKAFKEEKQHLNALTDLYKGISSLFQKLNVDVSKRIQKIDKSITETLMNNENYINKLNKLAVVGGKLAQKGLDKLYNTLDDVDKEIDKINKQKRRFALITSEEEQDEKFREKEMEMINKRNNIISLINQYEEKQYEYIREMISSNAKITKQEKERYSHLIDKMKAQDEKERIKINERLAELFKHSDRQTKQEADEMEYLAKKLNSFKDKQKMYESQQVSLNLLPTKTFSFNIITNTFDKIFGKKSQFGKITKGFHRVWDIFVKGIKILQNLPKYLNIFGWIAKIGIIMGGFVTLMVSSPTFRKLVNDGISKLGGLFKEQMDYLQKKSWEQAKKGVQDIIKGIKWLVWDEPINLINKYIVTPIENWLKSFETEIKKNLIDKPVSWIDKYIVTPISNLFINIKNGIKNLQWNKPVKLIDKYIVTPITNLFTSIKNIIINNPITKGIKKVWDDTVDGIKNAFKYIGYLITHPFHHKSFGDWLKDLNSNVNTAPSKQTGVNVKSNISHTQQLLKQYPVTNPNQPLIGGQTLQLTGNVGTYPSKIFNIPNPLPLPNTQLSKYNISLPQISDVLTHKYNNIGSNIYIIPSKQFNIPNPLPLPNTQSPQYNITPQQGSTVFTPNIKIPHKQKGGFVIGPGTGTDDKIVTQLSNGEYVIPSNIVREYPTLIGLIDKLRTSNINIESLLISPIKSIYSKIIGSVYGIKSSLVNRWDVVLNDQVKGNFNKMVKDIKNTFVDIKGKFFDIISDFKNIIPTLKKSFKSLGSDFMKKAGGITSFIKGAGGLLSGIGLSGIGGFLSKIAGPQGYVIEGAQVLGKVTSWLNNTIAHPINEWMHNLLPGIWADPNANVPRMYQDGGLVTSGYSFDSVPQLLSKGEYVIPNYLTSLFPSLVPSLERLKFMVKPHQTKINNGLDFRNIVSNNPFVTMMTQNNSSFKNMINELKDILKENNKQSSNNTVVQSNNVQSTNINNTDDYNFILGDISL